MMEANKASSSAKLVSIRTVVWGRAARMSRVASMPEPSWRRTSMTITSGRAWAATATASRAEPASAQTTTSVVSASSSLMPSRTTSWSSTSITRSGGALMTPSSQVPLGGLKRAGRTVSAPICLNASFMTDMLSLTVGHGSILDCLAEPVEEVLQGRLGHPVEQHPVDGPADQTQGWAVAGADGQLGAVPTEGADLDGGVQAGEQAFHADRLPGEGQRGHRREPDRLAELDRDPPPQPRPQGADPDRGQELVAAGLGGPGHGRQPPGWGGEHGLLDPGGGQGHLDVVAHEHIGRMDPPRARPQGPMAHRDRAVRPGAAVPAPV